MPRRPIAPRADDRRGKQGAAPIELTNCVVRATPLDSPRASTWPYFIAPTPGRVLRATMSDNVRGLFAVKGCQSGNLFIANGAKLSEMTSSLSYSDIGALAGGDLVTMRADRADLGVLAFGSLHNWDGTTFGTVNDADAPNPATTFAVVARRWIAAFEDNDAFGWSKSGLYNDWDANGQAVDQDLPDPIVGQEELAQELWSFNATSTQVWQPTGGAEDSAFSKIPGVSIERGLAARTAVAKLRSRKQLVILGDNRQLHATQGYDLVPIENAALEQDLKALSETELAACALWSYEDGGKEFVALSTGALEKGYVLDAETGLFHQRARYGASVYDIDFAAAAFGKVFVASRSSRKIWSLEDDVYIDGYDASGDAVPLIRDMTVSIPSVGDVPVDRLVFHVVTRDVPVTGQGAAPVMQVRTSNDGGESWSDWRELQLPTPSDREFHVQDFSWGQASHEHGMIVHIRISDPIGFAFYGVDVNPTEEELST
jgi:hypothetical protein